MTKDEVLKLALEALEELNNTNSYWWQEVDKQTIEKIEPAITAIKQALSQQALDRKAENARELGLDYEPAGHGGRPMTLRECMEAEEPEQEPVAHSVVAGALFDFMGWLTSRNKRMTLSGADEASPAVEAIQEFSEKRGLSLKDAEVGFWTEFLSTPPQRKPLSYEDLIECEQLAGIRHRVHMGSIRGQQLSPADEFLWHYARAIEAAHGIKE